LEGFHFEKDFGAEDVTEGRGFPERGADVNGGHIVIFLFK
jgi:hypothetical protein